MGGAATKSAYNLLGGFVEFDIDLSGVTPGVNANIYTISPGIGGGGYQQGNYCDGAVNDKPWCLEVDWIESNGNCGGATTLHTKAGNVPDDALLGAAEQATTTMAELLFTCALNM